MIYTDAATSTRITAALVPNNETPSEHPIIDELREEASSLLWENNFPGTTYIYGLEMLAIVGILLSLGGKLRNKTVVFYIDNSNCRDAHVSGYTETNVIDSLVQIFQAQINRRGIYAWFELIPSDPNPFDAPIRFASLPFPIRKSNNFGVLETLLTLVEADLVIKRSASPHLTFSGSYDNPHLWAHRIRICIQSLRNVGNPQ